MVYPKFYAGQSAYAAVIAAQKKIEDKGGQTLTGQKWAAEFCGSCRAATTEILLAAYSISCRWPDICPPELNILEALIAAPGRAVRCKLLLAEHRPSAASARFNRASASQLSAAGWEIRTVSHRNLLHGKFAIFDSRAIILGSHNLAYASATTNIDLSLKIEDEKTVRNVRNFWCEIWAAYGTRYEPKH